jgi:hypothetical protein
MKKVCETILSDFFFATLRKSNSLFKSNFSNTIYLFIFCLFFSTCSFSKEKGILPELLSLRALLSSLARAIVNIPLRNGLRLGVNVSGLSNGTLVLKNANETLSIDTNGQFFFVSRFQTGTNFSVTLDTTPEGNICTLSKNTGSLATVDSFVDVVCSPSPIVYSGQYWLTNPFSIPAINTDVLRLSTIAGASPPVSVAGNSDSPTPRFLNPLSLTTDGKFLFVGDIGNRCIRKIDLSDYTVTRIVGSGAPGSDDGVGLAATLNLITGISTDGVNLYVADRDSHSIRKLELSTNTLTTIAGPSGCGVACPSGDDNSSGAAAKFFLPTSVVFLQNNLYVYDAGNYKIKKIDLSTNQITTIVGNGVSASIDGNGVSASIAFGLQITSSLTHLYIAESTTNRVRRVDLATNDILTIVGDGVSAVRDGERGINRLKYPTSVFLDRDFLYIKDQETIRRVGIQDHFAETIFRQDATGYTDGESKLGQFCVLNCNGAMASDGKSIFFVDESNHSIRRLFEEVIVKYSFSETASSGSIVTDLSHNAMNGIVQGSPSSVPDINGNSTGGIRFDGSLSQFIEVDHNPILNTMIDSKNELSISFWVKIENNSNSTLLSKYSTFQQDGFYVQYYQDPINHAEIQFCQGNMGTLICTETTIPNSNLLQLNSWMHLAITKSSTNIVKFYINGTNAVIPSGAHVNIIHNTNKLLIGKGGFGMNGALDELKIFSFELSSREVARLATNIPRGLVAYFPFNNQVNSGAVFNVTHFTNTASSNNSTAVPSRIGFSNAAIDMGASSSVTFPSGASNYQHFPSGDQDFTVCGWTNLVTLGHAHLQTLISFGSASNGQAVEIQMSQPSLATDQIMFSKFGSSTSVNFKSLEDRWHFICSSYESINSTLRIYLDGSMIHSANIGAMNLQTNDLTLGQPFSTITEQLHGGLDDVRIYIRRLADNEILALSNFGNRRIFLTSSTATGGSFGSLANINTNICRNDANNPNGGPTGVWKAMISDDTNQRACTTPNCTNLKENISWAFSPYTTYVRGTLPQTTLFTTNSAGIPILPLSNPLILMADNFWTGTDANWTQNVNNCSNWSNDLFNSPIGIGNSLNNGFIDSGIVACSASLRLVCVEQY